MEKPLALVNSSCSRSVAIVDDEALVYEALLDLVDEAGFLALCSGAVEVLAKPFDDEVLLDTLRAAPER